MQYLTTAEAAEYLGRSVRRVQQFCKEGRLGTRVGVRGWLLTRREVERFAKVDRPSGRVALKKR